MENDSTLYLRYKFRLMLKIERYLLEHYYIPDYEEFQELKRLIFFKYHFNDLVSRSSQEVSRRYGCKFF